MVVTSANAMKMSHKMVVILMPETPFRALSSNTYRIEQNQENSKRNHFKYNTIYGFGF